MMSQTAPSTQPQHKDVESKASGIKDNAFVSIYNDGDITELLFKESVFASGFLPLEPEDAKPSPVTIPKRRLAAHFNTGTTPPTRGFEQTKATKVEKVVQTPIKLCIKADAVPKTPTKVVERRPSFIEVSTPSDHKEHHGHRRHSSETHLSMGWWPEADGTAQHVWVEKDQPSADEEEDMLEDCLWTDAFYD